MLGGRLARAATNEIGGASSFAAGIGVFGPTLFGRLIGDVHTAG